MKLIADANVWYNIVNGRIDPKQFAGGGQLLIATPTSLLEIASGIDSKSFEERRRAAQAVIDYASGVVDDTETHLASIWNVDITLPSANWIEGFRAIAQATSASELETGVKDYEAKVIRRVGVSTVSVWRDLHWAGFAREIVQTLHQWIPGYQAARSRGSFKRMGKTNREPFKAAMRSEEIKTSLLLATYARTSLKETTTSEPTKEAIESARLALRPYLDAYGEYIIRCAIEMAPQANDFGDCESFIYLQSDAALVISDDRWVKIAGTVCPSQIVVPTIT